MAEPLSERLLEIARRIDRNVPDRRDPERFHADKSAIVDELRRAAREVTVEQPR
jgi:hypothetical protein